MDPFRFRALIAPAMASLFLVLSLCAFVVQRQEPVGMNIPILKVWVHPYKDCDFLSDRSIVVQLHKNGSIWINETRVSPDELSSRLAKIFESREERIVYMHPDPDASFRDFADIYNKASTSISGLHVVLSTRQLDNELQQCPQGSSCGLEWPDHTNEPCVWSNI
ncbi:MAG TPA: biopolymer transporter ExbD, partial [Terracidiphilus sp.]